MNRKNTLCALAAALFAAHAQPSTDPAQVIVVTATRHAMALVDAPAAMSVVTAEQIAERGADNVFEARDGNGQRLEKRLRRALGQSAAGRGVEAVHRRRVAAHLARRAARAMVSGARARVA